MPDVLMSKIAAILPLIIRAYLADVPLRLLDPGKWSDVSAFLALIGGGKVLNICGRLKLWGSNDTFSGVRVECKVMPASVHGGRIIVRAGADPFFNATCTLKELCDGTFDHSELVLCVLSTIDFSSLGACDLDISILSPIAPGASLGTSASLGVAINRAILGDAYDALELSMRTLEAEFKICGKPTGNQDHIAAGFGSRQVVDTPVVMITIRNLFDVTVETVPVGPNIASWLRHVVVVFLGSHDSTAIHRGLQRHLSHNPGEAKVKLIAMRDTADMIHRAILADDVVAFCLAIEATTAAQRDLSPKLVSKTAGDLLTIATENGGIGMVPGAGGRGGSVVCCFSSFEEANNFVQTASGKHPKLRFYEAQCPGIN